MRTARIIAQRHRATRYRALSPGPNTQPPPPQLRDEPSALVLKARLTLPLGIRMTHEERYPRDNSSHTSLVRRDVSAGRSITRMYYTADDDVLLM